MTSTRESADLRGNGRATPHWDTHPIADEDEVVSRISAFPPIADYAFLSDCEVTALVAPSGNVEWMCLPRMDSPSVFGAILDRGAGGFRLGPHDVLVPAARRYLPGTMVVETSWGTSTGWIIVRDVLLMGPWRHDSERSHTFRRAPTDYDARARPAAHGPLRHGRGAAGHGVRAGVRLRTPAWYLALYRPGLSPGRGERR